MNNYEVIGTVKRVFRPTSEDWFGFVEIPGQLDVFFNRKGKRQIVTRINREFCIQPTDLSPPEVGSSVGVNTAIGDKGTYASEWFELNGNNSRSSKKQNEQGSCTDH